jgi:hypothetical protein
MSLEDISKLLLALRAAGAEVIQIKRDPTTGQEDIKVEFSDIPIPNRSPIPLSPIEITTVGPKAEVTQRPFPPQPEPDTDELMYASVS